MGSLHKSSTYRDCVELFNILNRSEGCALFDSSISAKPQCLWCSTPVGDPIQLYRTVGPRSHRTRSTLQHAHASYGTHCRKWECSHRLQATSKGLHTNLWANLPTRPVWTGPSRERAKLRHRIHSFGQSKTEVLDPCLLFPPLGRQLWTRSRGRERIAGVKEVLAQLTTN